LKFSFALRYKNPVKFNVRVAIIPMEKNKNSPITLPEILIFPVFNGMRSTEEMKYIPKISRRMMLNGLTGKYCGMKCEVSSQPPGKTFSTSRRRMQRANIAGTNRLANAGLLDPGKCFINDFSLVFNRMNDEVIINIMNQPNSSEWVLCVFSVKLKLNFLL